MKLNTKIITNSAHAHAFIKIGNIFRTTTTVFILTMSLFCKLSFRGLHTLSSVVKFTHKMFTFLKPFLTTLMWSRNITGKTAKRQNHKVEKVNE